MVDVWLGIGESVEDNVWGVGWGGRVRVKKEREMRYGRTVHVHMRSGGMRGIRHAELTNRTMQGIACPQIRMGELKEYIEAAGIRRVTGVYLLVGHDEEGRQSVYVGSAGDVVERILDHYWKGDISDQWYEAVMFVNKGRNLGESDILYLEARLCEVVERAARYEVWNVRRANRPALPLRRMQAMAEWFDGIRTMLGPLGHDVLEPLRGPCPGVELGTEHDVMTCHTVEVYELDGGDFSARGTPVRDGFTVLKGSLARVEASDGLDERYRERRAGLVEQGVLSEEGGSYRFERDVLFGASSAAASVVAGTRRSGPESWESEEGEELGRGSGRQPSAVGGR